MGPAATLAAATRAAVAETVARVAFMMPSMGGGGGFLEVQWLQGAEEVMRLYRVEQARWFLSEKNAQDGCSTSECALRQRSSSPKRIRVAVSGTLRMPAWVGTVS
ncbi:hypothetical protein L1887_54382 [Cichorium endivia]|nr:hypothetical protein L1887_54382 [Cichorium endivia]